jgi:hypothetical protein
MDDRFKLSVPMIIAGTGLSGKSRLYIRCSLWSRKNIGGIKFRLKNMPNISLAWPDTLATPGSTFRPSTNLSRFDRFGYQGNPDSRREQKEETAWRVHNYRITRINKSRGFSATQMRPKTHTEGVLLQIEDIGDLSIRLSDSSSFLK